MFYSTFLFSFGDRFSLVGIFYWRPFLSSFESAANSCLYQFVYWPFQPSASFQTKFRVICQCRSSYFRFDQFSNQDFSFWLRWDSNFMQAFWWYFFGGWEVKFQPVKSGFTTCRPNLQGYFYFSLFEWIQAQFHSLFQFEITLLQIPSQYWYDTIRCVLSVC